MPGDEMYHQEDVIGIVDDDLGICDSLDLLLSSYGYQTDLFARLKNSFSHISGVELGRQLPAMGHDFPIIFVTGSCDATIHR